MLKEWFRRLKKKKSSELCLKFWVYCDISSVKFWFSNFSFYKVITEILKVAMIYSYIFSCFCSVCFVSTYTKYTENWYMLGFVLFGGLKFSPSVKGKQSLKPHLVLVVFTVNRTIVSTFAVLKCWHKGSLS